MSVFDGVPEDLLAFFTEHEKEIIDTHYEAVQKLLSGEAVAANEKQENLLRVDSGRQKPSTGFEIAWARFNALKKAMENRKNTQGRIEVLEAAVTEAQKETTRVDSNAKVKYQRLLDEKCAIQKNVQELRDELAYVNWLYESTHDEHQGAIAHAALHEKDRDHEINALLGWLDNAYAKIRRYELDQGIPYTQPDRFTRLDLKEIPVVTYETMPPLEPSTTAWQCQACGRPIDFCVCAN